MRRAVFTGVLCDGNFGVGKNNAFPFDRSAYLTAHRPPVLAAALLKRQNALKKRAHAPLHSRKCPAVHPPRRCPPLSLLPPWIRSCSPQCASLQLREGSNREALERRARQRNATGYCRGGEAESREDGTDHSRAATPNLPQGLHAWPSALSLNTQPWEVAQIVGCIICDLP